MAEFIKRVVKPVGLLLGGAVFIALFVIPFSRILLAVPEMGSTMLALLMAAAVLLVAGVLAATSKLQAGQKTVLLAALVALIGGGAAAASIGIRAIEPHEVRVEVAAENIAFDTDELFFPAETPVKLEFNNEDVGVPHNVAVYTDDSFADALFVGDTFNGPAVRAYSIEPMEIGRYAFKCDVHPQMNGTVVVDEGEAPHPDDGQPPPEPTGTEPPLPSGGPAIDVVAKDIAFDVDAIALPADAPSIIAFDNQDQGVPHNVSIYADGTFADDLFIGEIITGVEQIDYQVPPLPAGTYAFRCDVHPQMQGTVTTE
ncbi:MAG TPA: cupredoxin domain-containing protein [Actinomycetota bacterium]